VRDSVLAFGRVPLSCPDSIRRVAELAQILVACGVGQTTTSRALPRAYGVLKWPIGFLELHGGLYFRDPGTSPSEALRAYLF